MISWDETIGGTLFELPTSLRSGKSISLNSIESHNDKPLRFLVSQLSAPDTLDQSRRVFLSAAGSGSSENLSPTGNDHREAELKLVTKSNYMAASQIDDADISHKSTLEIGTKSLKLDLIDVSTLHRSVNNSSTSAGRSQSPTRRLLEFDDESRSIRLPLERELRLSPEQTGSIALETGLASDNIVGTHEESLR